MFLQAIKNLGYRLRRRRKERRELEARESRGRPDFDVAVRHDCICITPSQWVQVMIRAVIKGGLGNQMFQYAHAKVGSCLHHQKLLLDLAFFEKEHVYREYLLPALGEWLHRKLQWEASR